MSAVEANLAVEAVLSREHGCRVHGRRYEERIRASFEWRWIDSDAPYEGMNSSVGVAGCIFSNQIARLKQEGRLPFGFELFLWLSVAAREALKRRTGAAFAEG